MRGKRNRRKNKQIRQILILPEAKKMMIILIIAMLLLFFSTIFALIASVSGKVIARVTVNGTDISNLTIDEAYKKLNEKLAKQKKKNIILQYEEYETTISLVQLEVTYKTEEALNNAYKIGRNRNILISNYQIIANLLFGNNLQQTIQVNEQELDKAIQDIEVKLPNTLVQSTYYIDEDQLILTTGKTGVQLKKEELKQTIIKEINNQINGKEVPILLLPIEVKEPEKINLDQIYEEICKPPKDAYYDKENKKLYKEENGIQVAISKEEANALLQEPKEEYILPLTIIKPTTTITNLSNEDFFPNTLAKFTTRYDESAINRANNIRLSAQKIDGTILMPAETFSYNKTVGERTIKAGYKEASVYMGGKVVNGIGGGICQVSSTLYNAVLLANLEIMERRNHYFITSYVSASRDATVSYGSIDFKFKNTRSYPIKIQCTAKNGICQIYIVGVQEEEEYEIEIQDTITEVVPYTTQTIKNNQLPKGETITTQKGVNGYKSEAYRILKQNGRIISKTLLSKDSYNPLQEIIQVGTK